MFPLQPQCFDHPPAQYFVPSCILSLLLCLFSVCMSLQALLPCCLAFTCGILCPTLCEPSMLLCVSYCCGGCLARPPSLFIFGLVCASFMCPDCLSTHRLCLLFSSGFVRRHGIGLPLLFSLTSRCRLLRLGICPH